MKKFMFIIVAMGIGLSAMSRQPSRGYRGFTDLSWSRYFWNVDGLDWHENHYGVSTVHGYQFIPQFYLGAGLEVAKNSFADSWYIPVFADFRTDWKFGRFTPFADVRVGYTLSDDGGFRFQPMVGHRFNWGRKVGVNLGIGLTLQNYKYYDGTTDVDPDGGYIVYSRTSRKNIVGFSLRLGIDF